MCRLGRKRKVPPLSNFIWLLEWDFDFSQVPTDYFACCTVHVQSLMVGRLWVWFRRWRSQHDWDDGQVRLETVCHDCNITFTWENIWISHRGEAIRIWLQKPFTWQAVMLSLEAWPRPGGQKTWPRPRGSWPWPRPRLSWPRPREVRPRGHEASGPSIKCKVEKSCDWYIRN